MFFTRRGFVGVLTALIFLTAAVGQAAQAETKRIMLYGDSNTWGWIPVKEGFPSTRYDEATRWPGIFRAGLGQDFEVIDEALSGRTTDVQDPTAVTITGAGLDGAAYLPAAIASHLPLDLVVIMLGTNDLKAMYNRSPLRIALGVGKLVDIVSQTKGGVGTNYPVPKVLVLCPPPLGPLSPQAFADMFAGGPEKSTLLPPAFEAIARAAGADFLDLGKLTATDGVDGIHLSANAHRAIGQGVADKVKTILR